MEVTNTKNTNENPIEYIFVNPLTRNWTYDEYFQGPGWYFWDENWLYAYGPYSSVEEAKQYLAKHMEQFELNND